jgi:hypothetical protein
MEKSSYAVFWEMTAPLDRPPGMQECLRLRREGSSNADIAYVYGVEEETVRLLVDTAWWAESETKIWRDFEKSGNQKDTQWWRNFRASWVESLMTGSIEEP